MIGPCGRPANSIATGRRPPHDARMTITELDPGDPGAMDRWYDLRVAVARHDVPDLSPPGRRDHRARFEHPWPGSSEQALLAWDGDELVGAASCLLPQADNQTIAYLDLIVHPRHRRRGTGTRLLEAAVAAVREHGRRLIEVEVVRTLPGGVARDEAGFRYLSHRGHHPGVNSIRSRCRLAAHPEPVAPDADGYSLVQWSGAAPEEIVDDLAALQSRLMADAPTGDLAVERQRYDAARLRAQESTERGRGHRSFSTAARHDATGQIVARTKVALETDDPAYGRQRITIVEPTHRGRRLGLRVKAANHAYAQAREPALRFVDAFNAEENTPMRAVNAALGFQPVDVWSAFQLPC
jgi:GNAT superfamily N-acetyltransferase